MLGWGGRGVTCDAPASHPREQDKILINSKVIIIGYKTWDISFASVGQLALMMTMLHHLGLMLNLFCSPAPVSCFQTHSNFEIQII